MSSRILKLTSAASVNLTPVGGTERVKVTGWEIWNTNAAARFVKLYWGNAQYGGAGGGFSGNGDKPTVGTDVPLVTIPVAATGENRQALYSGIQGTGTCFIATTVNAADTDNAAVGAGDLIISIFYE